MKFPWWRGRLDKVKLMEQRGVVICAPGLWSYDCWLGVSSIPIMTPYWTSDKGIFSCYLVQVGVRRETQECVKQVLSFRRIWLKWIKIGQYKSVSWTSNSSHKNGIILYIRNELHATFILHVFTLSSASPALYDLCRCAIKPTKANFYKRTHWCKVLLSATTTSVLFPGTVFMCRYFC